MSVCSGRARLLPSRLERHVRLPPLRLGRSLALPDLRILHWDLWNNFIPREADGAVREVFDGTIAKLRDRGAEIVPVNLPGGFDDVLPMHRRIMAVEAAEYHRQAFAAHRAMYGPKIALLLDEGLKISGVDYATALAWQREFACRVARLFAASMRLIMPSTDTTAPPTLETTGEAEVPSPLELCGRAGRLDSLRPGARRNARRPANHRPA